MKKKEQTVGKKTGKIIFNYNLQIYRYVVSFRTWCRLLQENNFWRLTSHFCFSKNAFDFINIIVALLEKGLSSE